MNLINREDNDSPHESQKPRWSNVWLIYAREMRDQSRDRRTLFTIIVLPILLYPMLGMLLLQIAQFSREYPTVVCVVGGEHLDGLPPLLADDGFAKELRDNHQNQKQKQKQSIEVVRYRWDEYATKDLLKLASEAWVRDAIYDIVIIVPPEMTSGIVRSADGDESITLGPAAANLELVFNIASDQSLVARDRVSEILNRWRERWVTALMSSRNLEMSLLQPFGVVSRDIAPTSVRDAAFWSKMLPFIMLVWAMTGAFYPAIDLVAGEKERGTLETLLCSPALRGEIVWGKLLAVTTFSMMTAILNVGSMLVTSALVFRQMASAALGASEAFSSPPLIPLLWLIVALLPLSALFSAVALAVAAMAKSSKEGQYYLMPLMMVSMPLVLLPMMPGTTLSMGTSLIPVTGMFLMVRTLVEGQYSSALMHLPMVLGVTLGALCLATRWARRQFETESVLFAGGDQWEFSQWARRLWQDRRSVATPGQAYVAAALVLIALFFGKLAVTTMPQTFAGMAQLIIVPQIGLILAPTLLMAIICTRSLRLSLRLTMPSSPITLPIAVIFAVTLHPILVLLASWISAIYPISEAAIESLKPFTDQIASAPWILVVLLMAVLPGVCEELAYRGFMFGGLAREGSPVRAIMITAVVFGISHGVLQQSISATCMGLILGWIAWQTGSVIPGILVHATSNALSLSMSRIADLDIRGLNLFIRTASDGVEYQPIWTMIAGCLAICCLIYFGFCREHESHETAEDELTRSRKSTPSSPLASAG